MKKAQGISVNVIIIAAIALLVLVILSVVYIGRMGEWGIQTKNCETQGGKCSEKCGHVDYGTENYPTAYPLWNCEVPGEDCCIAGE